MSAEWYIVNTTAGYENKVAKAIMNEAKKRGVADSFEDIVVPVETHLEIRKGRKVDAKKKVLPGYIMVRMSMNEEVWGLVKRIPNVAKFLGADNRPARISDREVQLILNKIQESAVFDESVVTFDVGDMVRIMDGPFETFAGAIESVDKEKSRLRVLVSILGHDASVDLEFKQVEKIDQ